MTGLLLVVCGIMTNALQVCIQLSWCALVMTSSNYSSEYWLYFLNLEIGSWYIFLPFLIQFWYGEISTDAVHIW